ncbi:hypothetical protein B0H11DRAFT_2357497 [Mycena galericulata]|nr:hypothetical protein B0H11DRAFT_2357497 [Mycena galericulata]
MSLTGESSASLLAAILPTSTTTKFVLIASILACLAYIVRATSPAHLTRVLLSALAATEDCFIQAVEGGSLHCQYIAAIAERLASLQIDVSTLREAALRDSLSDRTLFLQYFQFHRTFAILRCIREVRALETEIEVDTERGAAAGVLARTCSRGGGGADYFHAPPLLNFKLKLCSRGKVLRESLRYRIGGITPDRAVAAAAAQLMHVSPSITLVLLLPPPPGDTTERRRARRWRVAVARAARERQRGGCARFQGRGARVGSRVVVSGVATAVANRDSKQATRAMEAGSARWTPRGIKARRARAAGGARDKPGLSSGVELARCASDLRIALRARTHLRVPPASAPAGDAGAADREAWAVAASRYYENLGTLHPESHFGILSDWKTSFEIFRRHRWGANMKHGRNQHADPCRDIIPTEIHPDVEALRGLVSLAPRLVALYATYYHRHTALIHSLVWSFLKALNGVGHSYSWWTTRRDKFSSGFHTYALEWTDQWIRISVDTRLHTLLDLPFSEPFFKLGDFPPTVTGPDGRPAAVQDPWRNGTNATPFDQDFHLIMNVAVGGTNGWFPDGQGNKPWLNAAGNPPVDFMHGQKQWLPTWPENFEDRAMVVDYVRMWKHCGDP